MRRQLTLLIGLLFGAGTIQAALYPKGLDPSQYTSDFMIGEVVVSVVFPESNGSLDPNTETWTDERKTQVLTEIMAGLDWWTQQNPKSQISFTYVTETVDTKYEPILRPYYAESLWIPDVMSKLGYSGNRFSATRDYLNDLRAAHKSDWGFIIFMVDSLADPNGKFSDGYFAYSYLGGPYMVMTYDNNGYGINNLDVVTAHETGHIFHALDEYAGASSPSDTSKGYFVTINGNHAFSSLANEPDSIMRGGIRWGLSDWAKKMVGWRDDNTNNVDDIVDQTPTSGVSASPVDSASGFSTFNGNAAVSILARQNNANGYGLTVDTVAKVEYRIGSGSWVEATPSDGFFDSAEETFQITIDASALQGIQTYQSQDITIRVATTYASLFGSSQGSGAPAPSSLSSAHAFPNPFKPNSNLGHVNVTFTGLTPGAKVQIFTPAGEPVFEQSAISNATTLQWAAVNEQGSKISSGVYHYLLSDGAGTKKGKIAIIR